MLDDNHDDLTATRPFRASEIDRVQRAVSGGLAAKMRDHVVRAIDAKLRDQLVDVVNLNSLGALGAPQVMIRIRTLQTILDEFRRLQGPTYPKLLERIGRNIGFNFAISLIRILRNANWIPLNFSALLGFWARFDTAAQMGDFVFDLDDGNDAHIVAHIKNLFVTLGYGNAEPLRHNTLMIGYLLGATDTASLLWTRWLRASVYENPLVTWSAVLCTSIGHSHDGVTAFQIDLKQERWPEVRDGLVHAIEAFETGNAVKAMIDARMCLERAVLKIAGHPSDTRVSFARLMEQIARVRVDLMADRWRAAYDACSGYAHQEASVHNEVELLDHLYAVWECVCEAEECDISPEQRASIQSQSGKYVT